MSLTDAPLPARSRSLSRSPCSAPAQPASPAPSNPRAPADDPRIGLKAGLYDAGEAAFGLERLTSLPKPPGFDAVTTTPAPPPREGSNASRAAASRRLLRLHQFRSRLQRQPSVCRELQRHQFLRHRQPGEDQAGDFPGLPRRPGRCLGVRPSAVHVGGSDQWTHRLRHAGNPAAGWLCSASAAAAASRAREPPRTRRAAAAAPPSPDRFRGVRIFDISDLSNPKQVAAVQSCRGSHTHTLVIDPKDKDNVYIYISGTGNVRQAEELAGCSGGDPDGQSRHRVIPDRYHQGAAGASGAGEDRIQPAHLFRCANRSHQRPLEGRQPRRRHADHLEHR